MKTVKFPQHRDDASLRAFAAACEADFADRLSRLVDRIATDFRPIIALAGPSCAGKTTTAHRIIDRLQKTGRRVQVISLDDFYRPRDELIAASAGKGGEIDFDSPATLDWVTLSTFLSDVQSGRTARLPRFDFETGIVEEYRPIPPESYDCLLFEGIQAFYRQFLDLLPTGGYAAVFVTPESGFEVDETHLTPTDIRLCRRMVRDRLFRAASPEFTMQLWKGVTANENEYIFPSARMAHYHLDTFIGYELCLMRDLILDGLATLPAASRTPQTDHIEAVVRALPSLPREVMPADSMLHEFLG
ncbi:MAG: hypothetical protein IJX47_07685 [Clostridia bacterium]|nr:hypothetical protein [Clostridia bacterium]